MQSSVRRSLVAVLLLVAACAEGPSAPTPNAAPQPGDGAAILACTATPAEIEAMLTEAFAGSPDANAALGKWANIRHHKETLNDLATAKEKVFDLVDFILLKHSQTPLTSATFTADDLAELLNELFCYVGVDANIDGSLNLWIIHVGDPVKTFVTEDGFSGIQFPSNAVLENTLVTAVQVTDGNAGVNPLTTLLDKYPFVYDWSLSPAQTLTPGTEAIVGVCPNPALLTGFTDAELDALLARLVLGHQRSDGFTVLPPVPLPAEMTLDCGDTDNVGALRASLGGRILGSLASVLLPGELHAATIRKGVGGVGGSTSEFSPFGPVDSELRLTGGVGGSTSEFIRFGPGASMVFEVVTAGDVDGTVGTQKSGAGLPAVTIVTPTLQTPIPGVAVAFATDTTNDGPYHSPRSNASVCNGEPATVTTDAAGTAMVPCIDFGTLVQYQTAYRKLTADFTLPPELAATDAAGNPIVSIVPIDPVWLITSHGPSALAFTQPPAGRTVANNNPYTADETVPARVEIRSSLGEVVPLATAAVTLSLNQNAFVGGATTAVANAVAGVATFARQVPTAATGYQFGASASLSDIGTVNAPASNVFDVVAGAAAKISVVGTADYGTVTQAGNPVSPNPKVLVTDAQDNSKAGATVYWQPGGATGAEANGSTGQTTSATAGDGTTSATWLLGEGDNVLRASLQAASGGAEAFFTATLQTTYATINACAPGGGKDDILAHYFEIPGPNKNGGLIHSIGVYLSAAGAVGQIDETVGFPVTLKAQRTYNGTTETFTRTVTAFLRGDNGSSTAADRLVTFNLDIPPAQVTGPQPKLTVWFEPPTGGYGRRINFNAGPCSLGKCRPPPGCVAEEYLLPISSTNAVYRKSVGLLVKGQ